MIRLDRFRSDRTPIPDDDVEVMNIIFDNISTGIKEKIKAVQFYKSLTEEQQKMVRYIKDEAREEGYSNGYDSAHSEYEND